MNAKYCYLLHLFSQVNNGATFVRVNKFTNPRDGNPSLLVQGFHIYKLTCLFIYMLSQL
jgi:hypothetical protein